MNQGRIIVITGAPGTGKTNWKSKENFVLDLFHFFKYSFHYSLDKYTFDI